MTPRAVSRTSACRLGSDRGAVTVVAIGLMMGAIVLLVSVGLAGRVFLIHARVDGTADLAALAAADAVRGMAPGEPCAVARQLIERNDMTMKECISRPDLGTVKIVAESALPRPFGQLRASAVAGGPEGGSL